MLYGDTIELFTTDRTVVGSNPQLQRIQEIAGTR